MAKKKHSCNSCLVPNNIRCLAHAVTCRVTIKGAVTKHTLHFPVTALAQALCCTSTLHAVSTSDLEILSQRTVYHCLAFHCILVWRRQRTKMPATLRNGPTILASKPRDRKIPVIRQKTLQSVTMTQKDGRKTEQRPTLVDIRNKTSRIPVCGGIKKATKIASNETDVVCISNRKGATGVVKTQAATGHNKKPRGDATIQNQGGHHQRRKTERLMVPMVDTMPANVQDMDSKDEDPQMCQEYVRDIYKNLLELEIEESYTINKGFLEGKSEVQSWHRAVLVDWLIQVQRKFGLLQETLYICVDTLDRYLQVSSMDRYLPSGMVIK